MGCRQTPPDVTASDDDRDLHAEALDLFDFLGHLVDDLGRDVVFAARLAQSLAAEFEDDAAVFRLGRHGVKLAKPTATLEAKKPRKKIPTGEIRRKLTVVNTDPVQLPSSIPVMALSGVTLFPNALLPLYIFEPRYRQMLASVLAGDRIFAVGMVRPDTGEESIFPVAGAGLAGEVAFARRTARTPIIMKTPTKTKTSSGRP